MRSLRSSVVRWALLTAHQLTAGGCGSCSISFVGGHRWCKRKVTCSWGCFERLPRMRNRDPRALASVSANVCAWGNLDKNSCRMQQSQLSIAGWLPCNGGATCLWSESALTDCCVQYAQLKEAAVCLSMGEHPTRGRSACFSCEPL